MIRDLLRRPAGGLLVADALRAAAVVSIVVAALIRDPFDALSIAGAAAATLLPRLAGLRPAVDAGFVVATMIAAWSGVLALYESVVGWDLVVHFAFNGLVAVLAYSLAVRLGLLADAADLRHPLAAGAVAAGALGATFGVLWEFLEWFVEAAIDGGTQVGYGDTLLDLLAGLAGSVAAGSALGVLAGPRRDDGDARAS